MGALLQFTDRVTYELQCDEVPDRVQIVGIHGVEHLSRPYELRVDIEAVDDGTDLHAFVGTSVSVELRRTDEYSRTFSGIVDRVRVTDDGTIRIVPALTLLAIRANSRIFGSPDTSVGHGRSGSAGQSHHALPRPDIPLIS